MNQTQLAHAPSMSTAQPLAGSATSTPPPQAPAPAQKGMKIVYVITERAGRSFWTRVGTGFVNRDSSLNLRLEAIPLSGNLQVRDYEPRDAERADRGDGEPVRRAARVANGGFEDAPF